MNKAQRWNQAERFVEEIYRGVMAMSWQMNHTEELEEVATNIITTLNEERKRCRKNQI